jgi:glutamate racemase
MPSTQAVGIFDSGVGGLTVVAEVLKKMPCEDVVYFGDTARIPYGIKSPGVIREFSLEIARFLISKNVKAIVVACNTASAVALEFLREELDIPVIGVVNAGARLGAAASRSNRIAVIGTASTIDSRAYPQAVERFDPAVRTLSVACPLFVPLVEDTIFDGPVAEAAVLHYLGEIKNSDVDTIVLGCTHYPFLKPVIQETLQSNIMIVDAAAGVAEDLSELLSGQDLLNPGLGDGSRRFYFSDRTRAFQKMARLIIPDFSDDMIQVDIESEEFRTP